MANQLRAPCYCRCHDDGVASQLRTLGHCQLPDGGRPITKRRSSGNIFVRLSVVTPHVDRRAYVPIIMRTMYTLTSIIPLQ